MGESWGVLQLDVLQFHLKPLGDTMAQMLRSSVALANFSVAVGFGLHQFMDDMIAVAVVPTSA